MLLMSMFIVHCSFRDWLGVRSFAAATPSRRKPEAQYGNCLLLSVLWRVEHLSLCQQERCQIGEGCFESQQVWGIERVLSGRSKGARRGAICVIRLNE